jgi:hypothetical protein
MKVTTRDTTIYDSTLSPGKNYTYQALVTGIKSNQVTVKTMDTTSHNFTWQTWTFGGGSEGDSRISDVTIINDTLIYAFGEIYINNSSGVGDPIPYCLVKWNGQKWSLKKIYYKDKDYYGTEFTSPLSSIRGIFASNSNQIWLAAGSIFYWNGIDSLASFSFRIVTPSGLLPLLTKLWGSSINDIYGVGNSGAIIHYTNGSWQKITSGTSTDIMDEWGINIDGNVTVYCTVSNSWTPGDLKILKINNNKVDSVSWNINRSLEGIWTKDNKIFYVCGDGVYVNKTGTWNPINLPPIYTNGIRGNDVNDVFVVGDFGFAAHFNGKSWKYYNELYDPNSGYGRVAIKGNTVVMVGQRNGLGLITVGKRN